MKKKHIPHIRVPHWILYTSIIFLCILVVCIGVLLFLQEKIINTTLATTHIRFNSKQIARTQIQSLSVPETLSIHVRTPQGEKVFIINTADIEAKIDVESTLAKVYEQNSLTHIVAPNTLYPIISYSLPKLNEQTGVIASSVYVAPVYPSITLAHGELSISEGMRGQEIDIAKLTDDIVRALALRSSEKITIETHTTGDVVSENQKQDIEQTFKTVENASLVLVYDRYEKIVEDQELLQLIFELNGSDTSPRDTLLNEIKTEIETSPQLPVFKTENGRVVEFTPHKNGIKVKDADFHKALTDELLVIKIGGAVTSTIEIPVEASSPSITTDQVNDLGIKELIGVGTSTFRGSIPSRVHNIALASEKINGVLIAPGEIFSFNKTIGDISTLTGFKQSYVIQGNQTVLGDGGGVCQVSTTVFRAALDAGLEITNRRAHSYRVGYYEQDSGPGIDATIYSPSVDFTFRNDTAHHILLQTFADTKNMTLRFELYGTSDGRISEISKPVVASVSAPPEDLYIDDPTLPVGQVKQIDYAAWGARVYFDYTVTRDGQILHEERFNSNYRPWQAKYLRGTGV